jgi:cysteine desulfurase family protein
MPRIYLDNAATSFPKPESVYAAIDDYNRRIGAAAGRGAYGSAIEASEIVRRCRRNLATLLNGESPDRFAFAFNGTDALNMALHGVLRPGDHVVATAVEHNSVLRPLRMLSERGVQISIVPCDAEGGVSAKDVHAAVLSDTKLIVISHASNVTGAIQPVHEIVEIAKRTGVLTLLDAAQTTGHLPIDLYGLQVDLLATSGHKGLMGPHGTGVLYVRPGLEERLTPLRQGGTGTTSEDERQPSVMPTLLESGNLNVSGLAGLEAATRWILDEGVAKLRRHEQELTQRLLTGLREIKRIRVLGPSVVDDRVGVVSLVADGWTPHELAAVLDAEFKIEVRAGLHCAPRIHERLGVSKSSGTLRISIGVFTTTDEIDACLAALRGLCGE